MAHRFDSGLARAQRRLIREAIIDQLEQLIIATKPAANADGAAEDKFVVAVLPLAAPIQFDGATLEGHLLETLQGATPAILVALGNRRYDSAGTDARQWRGALDVHVYCVTHHARSLVDRLAGDVVSDANDAADPGLEVLLDHVFTRLAGHPLTEQRAGELRPVSEELVYTGDDYTVAEVRFTANVTSNVNKDRDRTVLVEVIKATHTDVVAGDPSDVVAESELSAP
jgi:hypothetical protein